MWWTPSRGMLGMGRQVTANGLAPILGVINSNESRKLSSESRVSGHLWQLIFLENWRCLSTHVSFALQCSAFLGLLKEKRLNGRRLSRKTILLSLIALTPPCLLLSSSLPNKSWAFHQPQLCQGKGFTYLWNLYDYYLASCFLHEDYVKALKYLPTSFYPTAEGKIGEK